MGVRQAVGFCRSQPKDEADADDVFGDDVGQCARTHYSGVTCDWQRLTAVMAPARASHGFASLHILHHFLVRMTEAPHPPIIRHR